MTAPFLLDTNAYALFFQHPKPPSYERLLNRTRVRGITGFYISEISSMEIHSVLGKYRRGSNLHYQQCQREILIGNQATRCSATWLSPKRRKMNRKVFRDMQKLISDIEARRGNMQATILSLNSLSIENARKLLLKYADRYNFSSHDALMAGSLIAAKEVNGLELTLVTSDKGLKAVLKDESLPFYDPAVV